MLISPMYKHAFDLRSGRCLDDGSVRVSVYDVRVREGWVWIRAGERRSSRRVAERNAMGRPTTRREMINQVGGVPPLTGFTVAITAERRREELAELLRRRGAG